MKATRTTSAALTTLLLVVVVAGISFAAHGEREMEAPGWSLNATVIEACSCPMFCQCYFNDEPAAHHDHGTGGEKHFCKSNLAFKVNQGTYGATRLDGAKFWFAGDLGPGKLSEGRGEWATLTFDPEVTPQQRDGLGAIMGVVFPFEWDSFEVRPDAAIEWQADKDRAVARLDGGRQAEVILRRPAGLTDDPIVIDNLKYWGAPRNDGFVLMPNEVQAYRVGDKAFEYRGTNGFMITFDVDSSDMTTTEAR